VRKILVITSIALIAAGIYICYEFANQLEKDYTMTYNGNLEVDTTGQVGDFIGGVVGTLFSLSAFLVLLLTLSEQSNATYFERFESKFFELVKFHRENTHYLTYTAFEKNNLDDSEEKVQSRTFASRQVFRAIFDQFMECRNELKPFFRNLNETDIFTPTYYIKLRLVPELVSNPNSLRMLAQIDITYCIVFYGLSAEGALILKDLFADKYQSRLTTDILNYLRLKPVLNNEDVWVKWRSIAKRSSIEKKKTYCESYLFAKKGQEWKAQ
jgi:hypothetical protein